MKILIIDNYDSFTYNLYQNVGEILQDREKSFEIDVIRNDEIVLAEIKKQAYDRIIISPGPGNPADGKYFGVCADILLEVGKLIPVLGVCLGMQGMAYYFGGKVIKAKKPMHGKTSILQHSGKGLFKGLPQGIEVMRYHSLIADPESLPECLEISAVVAYASMREAKRPIQRVQDSLRNPDGIATLTSVARDEVERIEIMGLRHKEYPIEGVQFHPESIGTEGGKVLLSNFLFK